MSMRATFPACTQRLLSIIRQKSDDDALAFLASDDFDPFAEAVVTSTNGQRPDLPDHAAENPRAQIAYEAFTPNYLRAHVQANQPVLVIFAEMNYAGWNA